MDELQDGYALGLDLGTTFSCIGVYRNGGVEIIPNRNGDKTTPSIVTIIDEKTILKGEETYQHLVKDYDSSIYAIKRFIGRDFKDKKVKEEINIENFPFKIVGDENGKFPMVAINKKNKEMKFTLEQISSFVIRKMADSAEDFLGKKVKKLVITVPANFTDGQRKCTENAAKLAGIEVLRIINEPTAAALAYGLGKTDNEAGKNKEKKILVFDLGGGTFDVTILNISKSEEQNFEILSTKGDKFLGGEDFDNKLVEHFLDNFCKKMGESKEKIEEDKKAIKRLKIACENIKKVLSTNTETRICLNNFYKNNDLLEDITRAQFEYFCSDLFEKLKKPIDDALVDAKLKKTDIGEIVLVGGSSRIPKVKKFLQDYFSIDPLKGNKNQTIINDSINPDETVAYGATLMAAKILIKNDSNLQGFNLMDITPLSLGINVMNESKNPDIQKEGDLMSVIIKRGTKIPFKNTENYETAYDNQTEVVIVIYEGEKKFTKYNHVLGSVEMSGIPPKKKGEVKIDVQFFIDVNGILTVTAVEKANGQSIKTKIINDTVGLTDRDIEELRKKNEPFYIRRMENKTIDYSNLKDTLKEFQDAYNEEENDDDKYYILMNYKNTLEEFIDLFNTDFDNETMVEKYYIYVKQLFKSYIKIIKNKIPEDEKDKTNTDIFNNIQKYLKAFYQHSSGYLDSLIDVCKDFPKKMFYEIIIIVIQELNNCGKNCLKERKKYCRYHSLMHFEKALSFYNKYFAEPKNLAICKKELITICKNQKKVSDSYIKDISSGAILLCEESLKFGKLIQSNFTGFTNFIQGLKIPKEDQEKDKEIDKEKCQIVLSNYEKMYSQLAEQTTKLEAICIANILKINIKFLGNSLYYRYHQLADRCEFIVNHLKLSKDEEWYIEFSKLYIEIKDSYAQLQLYNNELREKIKKKYKNEFDEIENKFIDYKNNPKEFIKYILIKRPYDGYEKDKQNNIPDLNQNIEEIINYLRGKYLPDNYSSGNDEKTALDFFIIEYIDAHLNKLYSEIQ